jgi:hypothetical protein
MPMGLSPMLYIAEDTAVATAGDCSMRRGAVT